MLWQEAVSQRDDEGWFARAESLSAREGHEVIKSDECAAAVSFSVGRGESQDAKHYQGGADCH